MRNEDEMHIILLSFSRWAVEKIIRPVEVDKKEGELIDAMELIKKVAIVDNIIDNRLERKSDIKEGEGG